MPSFNVPDDEKPSFNKKVKESLDILSKDVDGTLNRLRSFQPETLVESYNSPNEDPSVRDLSPLEQYFYEPQPVAEVADLTAMPQQESMVVPQEQPKVLSNLVNQYESVSNQDMVSVTPYGQEALDAFGSYADSLRDESGKVVGSALDVFAQPLDENKVKALGYVDNDMRPTEKGELFYNLVNAGMFNDNGTITEKGQAYMTPTRDVGKPENLKAFKILWDDEVIRSNASWGEIGAGTVNLLKDAAFGAGERLGQEAQSLLANSQTWGAFMGFEDLRPQQLRDEMTASGLGIAEGAVENIASYKGLAQIASAFVGKGIYSILPVGMDDEADQALYEARQRQWQTQEDMQNLGAGEIAETVLGINGAVKAAQEAKTVLGETEFEKRYGKAKAFSQFVDPVNLIPIGAAVNAAKAAPLASRIAITAQRRLGKIAAQDFLIANATTAIEAGNSVLKKEALTYSVANRLSSEIAQRAVNNPELVARSNQAAQVASRITEEANKIRTALPTLTDDLANMVAKRNSMATRIPETYYKKVLGTMELGRQLRSMPAKKIGAAFERVGETISKTDNAVSNFLQERGLDQMYTAAVGAAGIVGLAGNPVIGAIGAGAAILKTGKVLSNYGKLFRYVGKEMENARGQIPFWKRVARHTEPGSLNRGIAHTFNTFDLGGATSDILRRTGRGVLAAAPSDLMFEYLSDGADMRPETFYQAASESLVLGGSFAAGGGAFMGTKKRMRELSIGDELNFRRDMTDPRQKGLFELIPSSTRRAIATYSIANPTLNYVFKDSGASRYDINSNTAIINVNSTNPIKALVAHETLHHTIIKNNMESGISALFLGDTKTNTVGGLFRSKDGKLDPNFEAFKNGYYKRLGIDDMPNAERDAIYPLEKIAVEYFIEKHADQYAEMAESGKLGAVSASGAVKRKMSSILETVLPRIPVLKDLHFKSGGMIDANGSWVTGNGILDSEGVKRDPLTARMFRDMNRRSSGLAPGQFNPLMSDNEDSGASIFLDPANEIDAELLHPQVKVDEDGKPIRQNGQLVAIDKATELSRALAGLTAIEVLRRKREANYAPEKGEAYVNDEGEFQPGWLSTDVITEMFAKNNYNPEQKRIIREVNRLIRKGSGDRMVMVNFPATGRNKAGKVVYKPQKATLRDTVPVAVTVSKDGNLLIGLMSVTKLQENISKRAQSKRGKKLYSGNIDLILQDTQAMMDFHKSGTDSIEYFKARYGAVEADERKKFINTMFGLLNQKEQAVLNPILLEDGVKSRDNVYRTYRADRVSKAVAMSPEDYPSMPFNYEAVSQVKMPEQARGTRIKRFTNELTNTPLEDTFKVESDGPLFRSVTQKDWDRIQDQGYLDSDQRYAVSKNEGVNMASSAESAITYAPIGDNSVLLKINPLGVKLHGYIGDQYIRTWDKIKLDNIEDVGKFIGGETKPSYINEMSASTRYLPEPIDKKLQNEITQLQDQIDRMYESGRTDGVEDLEEKLETLLEKSETDMAAMQMESMQEFDDANPSQEEALVTSWYRWTGKGLPDESADLKRDYGTFGAFVRASQGDMIGKVKDVGTLNENISDKQIEDAAKESAAAYERRRDALKSSARDRNVTKAVNINDSSQDFTGQIIRGEKTIETRDTLNNALHPLRGQRVGLVRTGVGDTKIVGYATVGDQPIIYNTEAEFRKDQGKHLVPQGSEYDIKQGQKKYGYELKDVVAVKPFAPKSTNRKYSVIDPLTLSRLPEPLRQMPEPGTKLQPVSIAEFKRTASREDVIAVNKALKYISALGREYPESVQLRIQTDKNGIPKLDTLVDSDGVPILDSKGREQRGVVFSQEPYKLRAAPRLSPNDATARKQASTLLEADARAALAHPDSLTGLGWYSRMRKFLQRQLGSNIEVFGQLLGATSARTPVDANFRQTLEAIREFSSGAYDDLLQRYHQHVESVKQDAASGELESEWTKKYESWKKLNPKSAKKKYVESDEIRKKINAFDDVPLRPNGKRFNANSKKVLQALYGNWIEQTVGPKTPNFAGNLTGRTLKATIDVWAARNLRRLLYQGKVKKWRILPEQEKGVDDVDFSFGQDVFNDVAEKLGMNADDLQALMWFHEKGIWAKNNWTNTVGGKKSSFDEEANKLSLDRYQAGITTFTDSTRFDPSLQDAERKRIQTSIAALDGLVASRVTHSNGLYGDVVEPSFDVEFSIKRNKDGTSKSVSTVIDQLIDIAKNQSHRQMDTFVSQVVDDTHPNARPMVEIGFKSPASKADIDAVTGVFKNLGIDGFTVAKDQRGNVIGIRAQYIPEISARYDTPDHLVAEKFLENADKWMDSAESALIEAKKISNVSYTEPGHVSTTVYGTEEYDTATPTDISRTLRETELGRRKAILEQNGGPDNGGSNPVTGFSDDAGRSDSSGNVPADQG